MALLKFKMADLRPLLNHARDCKEHRGVYGAKPVAGLMLVKDEGIYLMSSGLPMLQKSPNGKTNLVVYARGFDPYKDGDVWDACRDAVGGDDFVEMLPLSYFTKPAALLADSCTISLTAKSLTITFRDKAPAKRLAL